MVSQAVDLGPLLPHHLSELIMGVVLMLVIYLVLRAKVVPKFEQMHAERAEAIQGGMEKAEKAQQQAEAALREYEQQLADARTEAARIREDAKTQGTQIIAEMREQAQAESSRIIEHGKAQIEAERQQAVTSLRTEVGTLATTLAGRIVGESLDDDERQSRVVERFLSDLEAGTPGQRN